MLAGATTSVVWEVGNLAATTTLAPMFAGLMASTVAIVVVSLATQKMTPVPGYIVAALEETAEVGPIPREMLVASDFALSPEAGEIRSFLDRKRSEP
jgi:sodium/proline symporter